MTNNNDDFDKFFGRMWKFSIGWIMVAAVTTLATTGVAVWAVIALVLHFT